MPWLLIKAKHEVSLEHINFWMVLENGDTEVIFVLKNPTRKLNSQSLGSLNFIRLLWVVFTSKQRLNRPAVKAVQSLLWRFFGVKIRWYILYGELKLEPLRGTYQGPVGHGIA